MIKNNNVPDSTIIKCLIRDNRCLIADIAQLEQRIEILTKEFEAKYTKKCQEFANYKKQSKAFYEGITKNEGIDELIKETRAYKKEQITRLKKEVEQLRYVTGKYARILQEHNLLKVANESQGV